ncbi:MAG: ABC transporter permease [Acidimicrobiia bacterium]|jgi:peptide/nickel transport system permease protein|nr:ABC transporter permease [Actinomycetota bacterium]NDB05713.1 ABC transporter permease [Acidimicrobiia bacterium]NDA76932.1 ABC transporter permease [Actinomycetota bacterium]NDE58207.1 ABC transporter permease [Acidimicrobiia bacterium]NDE80513.1 ABC transporter permease [Actinomycetota bacterium]
MSGRGTKSVEELDASVDEPAAGLSPFQMGLARVRGNRMAVIAFWVVIFYVFVAAFAPILVRLLNIDPYALDRQAINDFGLPAGPLGGVSWDHPFGVEPGTGRDILGRLMYGARISLLVGTIGTILTTVVGVTLGLIAGLRRGFVDSLISRVGDVTLAFPSLLLIIALANPMTQRLESWGIPAGNTARITYILSVLTVFGWVYMARLVRGQVLSLREREFVEAARSFGAGTGHLVFKQLLPNLWPQIIVFVSLSLPGYVALEATLSFLGVGLLAPAASWGIMLGDSVRYYRADPTYLFIPGMVLMILVLAFNLLGDGLRDAFDPRSDRQQL